MEENQNTDPSEAIPDNLLFTMTVASKIVSKTTLAQLKQHNLTPNQINLITLLRAEPEINSSAVTGILSVGHATVTRLVTSLAARGYVRRRRPDADHRVVMLSLTDEGVAVKAALLEQMVACKHQLMQETNPDEMETCLRALGKIVTNSANSALQESD